MAKKSSPLDVMNLMGEAAHKKAQPAMEPDADDMPAPKAKKSKQEKKKGNAKAPKFP